MMENGRPLSRTSPSLGSPIPQSPVPAFCKEKSSESSHKMEVDLTKVKEEPIECEYSHSTCSTDALHEQHMNNQEELLESPLPMRINRTRYVRRSYASPESSVCEVCQAEFAGPDVLRLHKIAHFNTATVCYVCDSIFIDSNNSIGSKLSLHMASQHKAICTPTGTYKPEAERSFVCSICLQRFSSNKILTLHTLKQHKIAELKNITCKICSIEHSSTRALQIHLMSSQHKDMKIKIQGLFMCVDCRAVFPARDSYAMHMMMRAQSESCTSLENIAAQENHRSLALENNTNRNLVASEYNLSLTRGVSNQNSPKSETPTFVKHLLGTRYPETKYASGYKCPLCGLNFYHPNTLSIHIKMSHEGMTDMNLLHQRSARQFDLEKTMGLFRGLEKSGMNWTCMVCGYDFHSCDSLAMHVMEKHSSNASSSVVEYETRRQEKHRASPSRLSKNGSKSPESKPSSSVRANSENVLYPVENMDVLNNTLGPKMEKGNKHKMKHTVESNIEEPKAKVPKCVDSDGDREQETAKLATDHSHNCESCNTTFDTHDQFLLHIEQCSKRDDPILKCLGCGKLFENVPSYSKHCCNEEHGSRVACLTCDEALSGSRLIGHFEHGNCCSKRPERMTTERGDMNGADGFVADEMNENGDRKNLGEHIEGSKSEACCQNNIKTPDHEKEQRGCTSATTEHSKETDSTINVDSDDHSVSQNEVETEQLSDALEKDTIIQALVQDAVAHKRNRRKTKPTAKVTEACTGQWHTPEVQNQQETENDQPGLIAIPVSPGSSPHLTDALPVLENGTANGETMLDATGHDHLEGQALFNFVLANSPHLIMCKYCHIIYTNRTMYYLHMGLHNLNNPWQCNLCGKVCSNVHEFSSHVIHYR